MRHPVLTTAATLAVCFLMSWALFTSSPAGELVAGALVLLAAAAAAALAGAGLVDAVIYLYRRISRRSCTTR